MNTIKVAIADDHEQYSKQVRRFLTSERHPEIEVCLVAKNGRELIEKLQFISPHIILMDIRMPVMDGIEATKIIIQKFPDVKIIAVTQFDLEDNIIAMNRLGVKSFIDKKNPELLITAINIVHQGNTFFPDEVAKIIQKHLPDTSGSKLRPISDFESRILGLICNGLSSTEIGKITNKSHRTIEDHRERLYKKFGVFNKEQLIMAAVKENILTT